MIGDYLHFFISDSADVRVIPNPQVNEVLMPTESFDGPSQSFADDLPVCAMTCAKSCLITRI